MFPRHLLVAAAALSACATAVPAADPETAAWWRTTGDLASDAMEGRDTGSPGHALAAAYVAERFRKAGLRPAGDGGTYFQDVPLREVALTPDGTRVAVARADGARVLRFLHEITANPSLNLPAKLDAPLTFRGRCRKADLADVAGKAVVCYGARGPATAPGRAADARLAGAAALILVDHGFIQEPAGWPVAYARTVSIRGGPAAAPTLPLLRLNAEAFDELIAGSGQDAAAILRAGQAGAPLPAFDIPARRQARFAVREREFSSQNVLAVLPGTDPALADEPVLLSAHLDGYGFGEPVNGDGLYNGALDDAAYVATLIGLAERRDGRGFRRPVVFAAFTGEEKGLLGSRWLADRPTPAAPLPVAVLNLDQLRPLYPLTILTTLAVDESTLGQDVRAVAGAMGVEVRPDLEPERNLLQRTDHWPFMQRGVPAVSFIFGFDPGGEAERRYRDWYANRYHRPQDDLSTPIDFEAAGKFNRFYFALTKRVADAETRPQWLPDSPFRPGR